jgi:serine/threonine-protein kinase RsbW/stage II sporulation protein AB (anti-sigma F factor)
MHRVPGRPEQAGPGDRVDVEEAIDARRQEDVDAVVNVAESDVQLVLLAEPESIPLARQMVRGIVDHLGWGEESRTDISIAVTEACTNSVLHAYPDGDGEYEVHAWADPGRLVVAVRDRGRGILPSVTSPAAGRGRGLPLIRGIGDEVAFWQDGGVTEVRMTFSPESRRDDG